MFKLLKNMRGREIAMAAVCLLFVVGQVYFDLLLPDYMTELTTLIKTSGTTKAIANVGLKMLGCTLISAALAIVCGYLAARTASGFSFTVREKLFHHVVDLGKEEMQAFSVPSLITRTTNDITQIQMIVAMGLQMLIKAPIMAVWAIIKILGKSWELSAVTAGFVLAICVTVFLVMATCIPRYRKVQKMTDKINRVARENLTGINVVHAFNAEEYQNKKFDAPSKEMTDLQMKNQKLFSLVQPTMSLGMSGLTLAIYWLGAALINNIAVTDAAGRIAMFSEILAFSTYATYIVMSFMMRVMIFMLVPQAQVSAERINEVLDKDVSIKGGATKEGTETGSVEFRNVSFRYPGSGENELSGINFKVNKGETLAIIGATGSGKTTLLTRLINDMKSKIRIVAMDVDIETDVDARRIAENTGVESVQIHNGGLCHIDAQMVTDALEQADFPETDLIVLENIGNLVCPAEFDTGAHLNMMLLSVPEGDDKPLKYPLMFEKCDVVVVTKIDTLEAFDFDMKKFEERVGKLNKNARIFKVSAKTGEGIEALENELYERIKLLKK